MTKPSKKGNTTVTPSSSSFPKITAPKSTSDTTTSSPPSPTASAPKKPLPDCLNPSCSEKHLVRDCPNTSPELREQLLSEYRKKKKEASINVLSTPDFTCDSPLPQGRFRRLFEDKVPIVINSDYGADFAAISERHLQRCHAMGVFVQTMQLTNPISATVAFKNDAPDAETKIFSSTKKVRLTVTMETPAGLLRLRNVEFVVFKEDMSEVLLSRPILQTLGFDLPKHLSVVRDQFHDTDFSNLASDSSIFDPQTDSPPVEPGTLAKLLMSHSSLETAPSDTHVAPDSSIITRTDLYGEECATETDANLAAAVDTAVAEGLPEDDATTLRELLHEYRDIFRSRLGSDPPMKVKPMKIQLRKGAVPFRAKQRRYSPQQAAFLRDKANQLLRLGLVYRNPTSRWASAPLIVPKTNSEEKFRFTVDLRTVNAKTEKYFWPMPQLETLLSKLTGSKFFFTIDLCHGYWQIPLDPESQECQSFQTAEEVLTPTRVLHGQTNAVFYFQFVVGDKIRDHIDRILQWLDDLLGHASTVKELLELLRQFFAICKEFGMKLHAKKCQFFKKEVVWCGRLISGDGIKYDPRNLSGLISMQPPTNGAELQQFVCASNWMRQCIPEFTRIIAPLHELLELVYKTANSRTKRRAARISLSSTNWGDMEQQSFDDVKNALLHTCKLAHPDPKKALCLFTDASDAHWSAFLTQIPTNQRSWDIAEQHHQPLSFLSGSFTGSMANWSTPEKESYAIVAACGRLEPFLLRPEGFLLYTDHKNLTFIYNPRTVNTTIPRHLATKIERWAHALSAFNFEINHIPGDSNTWADLMSRWGGPRQPPPSTPALNAVFEAPIAPALSSDFEWPRSKDILQSQQKNAGTDGSDEFQ